MNGNCCYGTNCAILWSFNCNFRSTLQDDVRPDDSADSGRTRLQHHFCRGQLRKHEGCSGANETAAGPGAAGDSLHQGLHVQHHDPLPHGEVGIKKNTQGHVKQTVVLDWLAWLNGGNVNFLSPRWAAGPPTCSPVLLTPFTCPCPGYTPSAAAPVKLTSWRPWARPSLTAAATPCTYCARTSLTIRRPCRRPCPRWLLGGRWTSSTCRPREDTWAASAGPWITCRDWRKPPGGAVTPFQSV